MQIMGTCTYIHWVLLFYMGTFIQKIDSRRLNRYIHACIHVLKFHRVLVIDGYLGTPEFMVL